MQNLLGGLKGSGGTVRNNNNHKYSTNGFGNHSEEEDEDVRKIIERKVSMNQ
jgi:hypothetical protein